MRRLVQAIWVVGVGTTTVVGAAFAIPDLAVAALYGTCGLAFPALYTATLALWLWCLGPAVVLAPGRGASAGRRALGALGAAASVGAFGLACGGWAVVDRQAAAAERSAYTADDRVPDGPVPQADLALDWPMSLGPTEAARALVAGGADRVAALDRTVDPPRRRLWVHGPAGATEVDDDGRPAAVTVRVDPLGPGITRIEALDVDGAGVARRTAVRREVVTAPVIVGPNLVGMHSRGLAAVRTAVGDPEVDRAAVAEALGWDPASLAPTEPAAADVAALLALRAAAPFTPDQNEAIRRWSTARAPWSEAEAAVFAGVVVDRRLAGVAVDTALRLHPEAVGPVLDRLLAAPDLDTPTAAAGWRAVADGDRAVLDARRDAIGAVLAGRFDHLPLVARVDLDPTPWLDAVGDSAPRESAAIAASCVADGAYRAVWVGWVAARFARAERPERRVVGMMARALLHHREDGAVAARMDRPDWPDGAAQRARWSRDRSCNL
ncbi:MAG: hypothetical protein ABMB14_11105 [Myxococcota bacterium]